MSRTGFITGLIISAAFHLWLFRYLPTDASAKTIGPSKHEISTVDVVDLEELQEYVIGKQIAGESSVVERQSESDMHFLPEQKYNQQPAEPTQTVELAESNKKLFSYSDEHGDFAGSMDGIERAILRINWGSTAQAIATLRACDMRLVILEPDGSISRELMPVSASLWQVRPLAVQAGLRYSDAIRLVNNVPAFTSARVYTKTGSGQSLAVLMPVDLEKMIETKKITYIYQRGLEMRDVSTFGGYFSIHNGNVDFVIDKIQLRR